jgi:hypothetical protein
VSGAFALASLRSWRLSGEQNEPGWILLSPLFIMHRELDLGARES